MARFTHTATETQSYLPLELPFDIGERKVVICDCCGKSFTAYVRHYMCGKCEMTKTSQERQIMRAKLKAYTRVR